MVKDLQSLPQKAKEKDLTRCPQPEDMAATSFGGDVGQMILPSPVDVQRKVG
jgi:hypothetical protein